MELSELLEKRETLLAMVASGTLSASFNGRSITYRSMSELKEALSIIDGEIAKEQSPNSSSFSLGVFRKTR